MCKEDILMMMEGWYSAIIDKIEENKDNLPEMRYWEGRREELHFHMLRERKNRACQNGSPKNALK